MVKRTFVVLGILSLMLCAMGTSHAFLGSCPGGDCFGAVGLSSFDSALYVPVDCPPYPTSTTIVKTWKATVEGPASQQQCGGTAAQAGPTGLMAALNPWAGRTGLIPAFPATGLLGGIAAGIASPFDLIFGGLDGVYGCGLGLPGLGTSGPCGPCFGPVPGAIAAVPQVLAAPTTIFGALW